jgi:hypothetical protein
MFAATGCEPNDEVVIWRPSPQWEGKSVISGATSARVGWNVLKSVLLFAVTLLTYHYLLVMGFCLLGGMEILEQEKKHKAQQLPCVCGIWMGTKLFVSKRRNIC